MIAKSLPSDWDYSIFSRSFATAVCLYDVQKNDTWESVSNVSSDKRGEFA